jgi:lipid II:glycine glycyltransferase (peptidoglycan interpeptide bridge formation enzyme)
VAKDEQILALFLPVQINLMNKWLRSFSTRAVSYGNVLFAPGPEGDEALSMLLQTYVKQVGRQPLFTELRNLTETSHIQLMLREHGFNYEEHLNYLIDIKKPPQAILQSIGERTRKYIQRGIKQGKVNIVEADNLEHVAVCYELLQKTYRASHIPLADYSLFKAAFQVLHPREMIRITLAYVDQTPVASSIELLYKDIIYAWYGGLDRTYGNYRANELLTWRILEWGAEHGYTIYDFGGGGKPGEPYGPREYKAKFGGVLVNYGRNVRVHAPIKLKISRAGYQLMRYFI